jgi:mRNA-degrading endonuclease RelE of RelBE toxin-antitoxin system
MYQLTFSAQSLAELEDLGRDQQLFILNQLGIIDFKRLENDPVFGKITRDGTVYYRIRMDDLRIYFEKRNDNLHVHYILPKHTWNDFVFRLKLPFTEDMAIEKHHSFWKYLESLRK